MESTGVAELKAHLSSYLKRVKAGREFLITERGLPVAKLVPLGIAEQRGSRLERLAKAGTIVLGKGRVRRSLLRPLKGNPKVGDRVLAALLAERAEGR